MPKLLPEAKLPKTIAIELRRRKYFPSIFRFIPEKTLSLNFVVNLPGLILVSLISFLVLLMSINQYLLLNQNRQHLKSLAIERQNTEKELAYWKNTAGNYNNYPDIYLKIASLEYQLNNTQQASILVDKALSLNPNIEQGRVLGAQIKR